MSNTDHVRQSGPDPEWMALVREIAQRAYPSAVYEHEVPWIVVLDTGIHPYNRAGGWYSHSENLILLYQPDKSLRWTPEAVVRDRTMVIIHELAHWRQWHLHDGPVNSETAHRVRSWKMACMEASRSLWGEHFDLRDFSVASNENRRRVHHWPRSFHDDLPEGLHLPSLPTRPTRSTRPTRPTWE